jgi:hypothetical protein
MPTLLVQINRLTLCPQARIQAMVRKVLGGFTGLAKEEEKMRSIDLKHRRSPGRRSPGERL